MTTFIAVLLIALAALAMWHFFYEAIIMPSVRLNARFKLFALRDELRDIKVTEGDALDDHVFSTLNNGMNDFIDRLPAINISTMVRTQTTLENNPRLRAVIIEEQQRIAACGVARVVEINEECAKLFANTFVANSGGWFVYLIPVVLCMALYKRIGERVKSLLYLSKTDRDMILPPATHAPVA